MGHMSSPVRRNYQIFFFQDNLYFRLWLTFCGYYTWLNQNLSSLSLQRQQKLRTSRPLEAWWWTRPPLLLRFSPTCLLRTSQSACDTLTLSLVPRSRRITCGWSTVRAKSLNPTGEFGCVRVCIGLNYGTIVTLFFFSAPYYHFMDFQFTSCLLPCLLPSFLTCSSVQLHPSVEGDGEYLLLEECESKPPPPQTSLWVASHPVGTVCLPVCSVAHALRVKELKSD